MSSSRREHQRKTGQPRRVFLDFTGLICSNCRYNEQHVFTRPDVQAAFRQYHYVELYTDGMPVHLYAPAIRSDPNFKARSDADAEVNAEFQQRIFDESTLPLYAILEPRPTAASN